MALHSRFGSFDSGEDLLTDTARDGTPHLSRIELDVDQTPGPIDDHDAELGVDRLLHTFSSQSRLEFFELPGVLFDGVDGQLKALFDGYCIRDSRLTSPDEVFMGLPGRHDSASAISGNNFALPARRNLSAFARASATAATTVLPR